MNRGMMIALIAAVLLLTVGVAGIAGYLFFFMPKGAVVSAQVSDTRQVETVAKVYKLNKFVTNLADTDRLRYIDVTVALGLSSEGSETYVKEAEPQIRDRILREIRSLTAADLAGPEGADKLAKAVEEGLADLLKGHLTKVYVTDMVIQ